MQEYTKQVFIRDWKLKLVTLATLVASIASGNPISVFIMGFGFAFILFNSVFEVYDEQKRKRLQEEYLQRALQLTSSYYRIGTCGDPEEDELKEKEDE